MEDDMSSQGNGHGGIGERLGELEDRIGPQLEQVRTNLEVWNQKALRLMRERPGTCLLCAVGIGFLVGRIASRR